MQAPKVLLDESRLADQEFLKVAVALRMVEEIVANEDEAVALLVVVLSTLKQLHGQLELAIALKRAFLYFRHQFMKDGRLAIEQSLSLNCEPSLEFLRTHLLSYFTALFRQHANSNIIIHLQVNIGQTAPSAWGLGLGRVICPVIRFRTYRIIFKSLLFPIFPQMESSKSKSAKVLRKLTSPENRTHEQLYDLSNFKSYLEPRKQGKGLTKNASRPLEYTKKSSKNSKAYLVNKTALGTPYEKSVMFSYISTPNEKSFNAQRLRIMKGENGLKIRQQFQSTQDDNFGEEVVRINLLLGDRKSFSKHFASTQKISVIGTEFDKVIHDFVEKAKTNYYAIVGFQTVPFNYNLCQLINSKTQATFQDLVDHNIKELTITPSLLRRPISYETLEFSDFQIVKFLGSGGFSQVYLGKCRLDLQYCALKFIRKDTITTAKKVKMLQNEKNILFSIKHENLIDLLYAFETKHYIVFGLEYCPNGNLYSYLQKVKTLSQGQAKSIMLQILNGLDYLHKNNILFRDIKLENILFDIQGKIKITDFGLSKPDIDEDEITYSYCGSPEYMAPEMLAKSGHSYQVDFYALGILLYELLYGRSPFYAPKKEEIFQAILHSEPKFPKSPAVSKEVKSLIKGLLAKNPSHRIGSLKGIKEILVHPWFKIQDCEAIKLSDAFLYDNHGGQGKRQLEEAREMFTLEQSDKKFQKMFFSQNFVNRTLYDKMSSKLKRLGREQRTSKGLFTKSSSKRK